jgi:hypothetical protein
MTGLQTGTVVTARWQQGDQPLKTTTWQSTVSGVANVYFRLAPKSQWQPGPYSVEVAAGGQPSVTRSFTVAAGAASAAPQTVTMDASPSAAPLTLATTPPPLSLPSPMASPSAASVLPAASPSGPPADGAPSPTPSGVIVDGSPSPLVSASAVPTSPVVDAVLCKRLGTRFEPMDPTDSFGQDESLHCSVLLSQAHRGQEFKLRWYNDQQLMQETSHVLAKDMTRGYLGFTLVTRTGWKPGSYQAEVDFKGLSDTAETAVRHLSFEIQP